MSLKAKTGVQASPYPTINSSSALKQDAVLSSSAALAPFILQFDGLNTLPRLSCAANH